MIRSDRQTSTHQYVMTSAFFQLMQNCSNGGFYSLAYIQAMACIQGFMIFCFVGGAGQSGCRWEDGGNGEGIECSSSQLVHGECGSGGSDKCGSSGVTHQIQCCGKCVQIYIIFLFKIHYHTYIMKIMKKMPRGKQLRT